MKRLIMLGGLVAVAASARPEPASNPDLTARELLALLPDGPMKRQFIVDCTGCHGFHSGIAYPRGKKRTEQEWRDAINRMLGFAGPTSNFPVISVHASADSTARWLAASLPATMPAAAPRTASAHLTEYLFPAANDLPHDVAVQANGHVVVTGMFSHQMYVLDPATKQFEAIAIPVERANPRAVEIDKNGKWWVVLGNPQSIGIYDPTTRQWRTHEVGMYPHSVALDSSGRAWYNGHFSVNPELIGRVDINGSKQTFPVPAHPVMSNVAGGPVPYELRAARDGAIWGSELQGNRIFRFDPKTEAFRTWDLPTSHSGPRRLDIDAHGNVWIPQYGAGTIAHLDVAANKMTEISLPIANTAPYIVRVDDPRNVVWIATGAGDVVFKYTPATRKFDTFHLPSVGALVRHMAIDPSNGDVWLAYGASPGTMPARIARLRATE
jgi:virginiamycin B lyase